MKATTEWSFRKQHLRDYPESHFANDWDYFVYLHLNDHVRWLHLGGTLVGLALLPWATYRFIMHWEIWPGLVYTFFYYGVGFISHYIGDGQVSGTWRQLMKTYRQAVKLNLLSLNGKYGAEEAAYLAKYPETLWVYRREAEAERVDSRRQAENLACGAELSP